MKAGNLKFNLVESYFSLLKNLSIENKLELISRLKDSLKRGKQKKNSSRKFLSGDFIPEKTADEIINEIRQARTFNRNLEEL